MERYIFPAHIKGDTFNARRITLGFDITGVEIKMQFKLQGTLRTSFFWSTTDQSITVNDAVNGIITMNSRILDESPVNYVYDFQIKDSSNNVRTLFGGSISIKQDITQ